MSEPFGHLRTPWCRRCFPFGGPLGGGSVGCGPPGTPWTLPRLQVLELPPMSALLLEELLLVQGRTALLTQLGPPPW